MVQSLNVLEGPYELTLLHWLVDCSEFHGSLRQEFNLYEVIFLREGGRTIVVVDVLLFYVHGKHIRSCRGGQLTYPHFSWTGLDLLSG